MTVRVHWNKLLEPVGAIADLVATTLDEQSLSLSFTPAINSAFHEYRVSPAAQGNWTTPAILDGTTITGLQGDTSYDVQVRGRNTAHIGDWSNTSTASTAVPIPDPPGAISDLVATALDDTRVELEYTPAIDASSHEVQYSLAGDGDWSAPTTLVDNYVTGLTPETAYDFQLRGVNLGGVGPWSNTATATTQATFLEVVWNENDKSGLVTLSNNDRTATGNQVELDMNTKVRATKYIDGKKLYWEIVRNFSGTEEGGFFTRPGWGTADAAIITGNALGHYQNTASITGGGDLRTTAPGAGSTTNIAVGLGTINDGDVLRVAYDEINHLVYLARGDGLWNPVNAGADPVAGEGGINDLLLDPIAPMASCESPGSQFTIRSRRDEFSYLVPDGFDSLAEEGSSPVLPGSIGDLAATPIDHQSISLTYTPASSAASHQAQVSLAGSGNWGAPIDLTNNTVSGLATLTDYDVQVRGVSPLGEGPWSNTANVTTLAEETQIPGSIADLAAVGISAGSLQLTFTPATDATSHEAQFRPTGGTFGVPVTISNNQITGLQPTTEYEVQVRGVNVAGVGPWSNIATGTTLSGAVLSNPLAVLVGNDGADVTVTTDTVGGLIYCTITESATQPTPLQVMMGQDHTGSYTDAIFTSRNAFFSINDPTPGAMSRSIAGVLLPGKTYYAHFTQEDDDHNPVTNHGNLSAVVTAAPITTLEAGVRWSETDKADLVIISENGALASTGSTSNSAQAVRANNGIETDNDYYFEFEIPTLGGGSQSSEWGVGNSSFSVTLGTNVGNDANAIGVQRNTGDIRYNAAVVGSIGAFLTGLIGVAVKKSTNQIFFRQGTAGNWNNSATADPVTGVEGIALSVAGTLFPVARLARTNTSVRLRVKTADFLGVAPSGFAALNDIATVIVPVLDVYVSSSTGNDNNDGTIGAPIATIGKHNSMVLGPGSQVFFNRGDQWNDATLAAKAGVTYDAYGTGDDPALNYLRDAKGIAGDWTEESTNVWSRAWNTPNTVYSTVLFNGQRANLAGSVAAINTPMEHAVTTSKLWVYAEGNPTIYWDTIQTNHNSIGAGLSVFKKRNTIVRNLRIWGVAGSGVFLTEAPNFLGQFLDIQFHGSACVRPDSSNNYAFEDCFLANNSTGARSGQHGYKSAATTITGYHGRFTRCRFERNREDPLQITARGIHLFDDCTVRCYYAATNSVDLKVSTGFIMKNCIVETIGDHAYTCQAWHKNMTVEDCIINNQTGAGRNIIQQEGPGRFVSRRTRYYYENGSQSPVETWGGGRLSLFESDILIQQSGGSSGSVFTNFTAKYQAVQTTFVSFGVATGAVHRSGGITVTELSHDGSDDGNGMAWATLRTSIYTWGREIAFTLEGLTGADAVWNGQYITERVGNEGQFNPGDGGDPWMVMFKVPNTWPQNPSLTGLVARRMGRIGAFENCIFMSPGGTGTRQAPLSRGDADIWSVDKTNSCYLIKTGATTIGAATWSDTLNYSMADSITDGVGLHLESGGLWGGSQWKGDDNAGGATTQFDFISVTTFEVGEAGICTVTTATPHGYVVGERVLLRGAGVSRYNGWHQILTVPDTTHFTFESYIYFSPIASVGGTKTVTNMKPAVGSGPRANAPSTWAPALMSENKDANGNPFSADTTRSYGAIQA